MEKKICCPEVSEGVVVCSRKRPYGRSKGGAGASPMLRAKRKGKDPEEEVAATGGEAMLVSKEEARMEMEECKGRAAKKAKTAKDHYHQTRLDEKSNPHSTGFDSLTYTSTNETNECSSLFALPDEIWVRIMQHARFPLNISLVCKHFLNLYINHFCYMERELKWLIKFQPGIMSLSLSYIISLSFIHFFFWTFHSFSF